ncbi:aminomethyl-transferring glycine dehydrogenase subunit GcvPA [Chitinispirillales bacterium ANBcel5]|uniref:aminomethyl-transferring glycine dehydrogenase subunit GcvPA n=1 Tax=Cellulosispirillum alkaliphilum TaxID=3039283 RepID=UPI002A516B71|nr:aminomethyl-transferring glycine dehydrogenase subunit GcvPA [Chitinispirillales bacterium ANBcel5]
MSYVSVTPDQQKEMLKCCGAESVDELFNDIPQELRPLSFSLPEGKSELEVLNHCRNLSDRNYSHLINFLGAGYYDHYIPAAVDALAGRSEFYTAYTPYQPELSQGTLQAIYEYQSHICRLTGLKVSNASLYDGGTALYEACQMAINATKRPKIILDGGVNPIFRKMLYSYTANLSIEFVEVQVSHGQSNRENLFNEIDENTAAVILQNPNFFGVIDDHSDIAQKCSRMGVMTIQSVYPIAMALLKTPAQQGIDIATGEGQSLGNGLSFGGPYLGFIAARKQLVRKMPGRIVARTVDKSGKEGFVLSLQAREQHIRREKATSNICTNEALCALRASIHLALLGKGGLKEVASLCLNKAHYAKERIKQIPGVKVMESSPTFNEFTVKLPKDAAECVGEMVERGFAAGFPLGRYYKGLENYLLIAVTEKRSKHEIGLLAETLEAVICR